MWPRPNAKGKRPFNHFYQRKLCASFSGLWFAKTFWEFLVNSSYLIVKLSAMQLLTLLAAEKSDKRNRLLFITSTDFSI